MTDFITDPRVIIWTLILIGAFVAAWVVDEGGRVTQARERFRRWLWEVCPESWRG